MAEPRDVAAALRQLMHSQRSPDETLMLVAPAPRPGRVLLQEGGVGWFDATGNLRLQPDRPAVFIDVAGASRNPSRTPTTAG